jgi:hypothetical protein
VKTSALGSCAARKARYKEVGCLDGGFYGSGPVLSRQQLLLVEPGAKAVLLESLVQLFDERKILLDLGDEHPRLGLSDKAHAAHATPARRYEFAQAVDLHRGSAFQSLA